MSRPRLVFGRLIRSSFAVNVRALDAIHVATAEILAAEAEGEPLEFWTHDQRQPTTAMSRGLTVRGLPDSLPSDAGTDVLHAVTRNRVDLRNHRADWPGPMVPENLFELLRRLRPARRSRHNTSNIKHLQQ